MRNPRFQMTLQLYTMCKEISCNIASAPVVNVNIYISKPYMILTYLKYKMYIKNTEITIKLELWHKRYKLILKLCE